MNGQIQPISSGPLARQAGPRGPMVRPAVMTPKEMLGILRRHILLMISLTILGFMLGGVTWFLLRRYNPKYTAVTFIDVRSPEDRDPMMFGGGQTQKDIYYQFRFTKAASMKQLTLLQELLGLDTIRETEWFKQFCKLDSAGNIIESDIAGAVEDLKDNFGASAPRDATWIQVSMTCRSRDESALIVNEIVKLFTTQQRELATQGIGTQLKEKNDQANRLKNDLASTEQVLDTIREGTEFVNLANTQFRDYLSEKLTYLESRTSELRSQIGNLESITATLRERAKGEYDVVVREQIERDPVASEMRRRIAAIEPSLSQLLTRFGEDHRRVKEVRDALAQMKQDLAERQVHIGELVRKSNERNAEDQLTAYTKELETLKSDLLETQKQHADMDRVRARYQSTMKIRDDKQELLNEVNTVIEKLNMQKNDPTLSKLMPMGDAPKPLRMSSPKWEIYFPAGFVLGLLAGIGIAFLIEVTNDLVRTPSDVMRHIRVPLLGMICHADEDDAVENVDLCHAVRQAPYSIMSECYRQFRTNLKLSSPAGESRKTILITSCAPSDGKTCVAVNLASTLIAENNRVLLVDTNFRRPATAMIFPRAVENDSISEHPDFGLSNYLLGQCEGVEIVRPSGIEGLYIVDSGPLPPNPGEILGSSRMQDFLKNSSRQYDYIIIDGPPLLVSDAKTLAAEVDGTILVFNATKTRRGAAQRTARELREINANIAGTVLVGVRVLKGGYFQEIFRLYEQYQQVQVAQPV